VVATRDLPIAAWRDAYRLSFLTAALYNLRLLRVVLHAAVEAGGIARRALLVALAEQLARAAPGSVYAALGATLDRYADSILASGPLVLPLPGADPHAPPVAVDDALATIALARYDAFLAETAAALDGLAGSDAAARALVAEAFAYQRLITPRWQTSTVTRASFAHDWPRYLASGATGVGPAVAATVVTFTPPSYVDVATAADFVSTHLAVVRTRLDVGVVTAEAAAPGGAPVRRLNVLPVSG
jgi:hypothetical protein